MTRVHALGVLVTAVIAAGPARAQQQGPIVSDTTVETLRMPTGLAFVQSRGLEVIGPGLGGTRALVQINPDGTQRLTALDPWGITVRDFRHGVWNLGREPTTVVRSLPAVIVTWPSSASTRSCGAWCSDPRSLSTSEKTRQPRGSVRRNRLTHSPPADRSRCRTEPAGAGSGGPGAAGVPDRSFRKTSSRRASPRPWRDRR